VLLGLIALGAAALGGKKARPAAAGPAPPRPRGPGSPGKVTTEGKLLAAAQAAEAASSTQLEAAANMAAQAGLPKASDEFARQSMRKKELETAAKGVLAQAAAAAVSSALPGIAGPIPAAMLATVPFAEASPDGWERFVKWAKQDPYDSVTPSGLYGAFRLGARTLVDLGYMRNPRQTKDASGRRKWVADWIPPLTLEKWQKTPDLQYEAFARVTMTHRRVVLAKHADAIGVPIAAQPATLSGLLGVARWAGLSGLDKWLAEPQAQRKPDTTKAFFATNGLF
jgi:hypothetical protein